MNQTDKYLVIGNPISHSLSPQIHSIFAEQTQQNLVYDKFCVEPEHFFNTLEQFFSSGGKGANITAPFKSMAYEYTQEHCSEAAKIAKAVNTLYFNPEYNSIWGDNTDGIGLLRSLERLNWNISDKKLLILGSGGAVQGILALLLKKKPESITLYNRTQGKAKMLARSLKHLGKIFTDISEFSESLNESPLLGERVAEGQVRGNAATFDFVFNGISGQEIKQSDIWEWLPQYISTETKAYDLSYTQHLEETPFIQKMKKLGCTDTTDGFGMLVEQAAESFYIWRGIRPDTGLVYSLLSSK